MYYSHIVKLAEAFYPYPGTQEMEKKFLKEEKIATWTNVHKLAVNKIGFTPSRREFFCCSFSKEQWVASPYLWRGFVGLNQVMKEIILLLRCLQYHETALSDVGSLFWAVIFYKWSQRLLNIEGNMF